MRKLTLLLAALAPLACTAQSSPSNTGATSAAAAPAASPTSGPPVGWAMHTDKPTDPKDQSNFRSMGSGFHVTNGSVAAIYFDTANVATGTYSLTATFTQEVAPTHPEAYGLIFGGHALTTDTLDYIYFLVRGDGSYLIKHHATNGEIHTLADWTKNAAVHAQDAAGKATNELLVKIAPDSTHFFVNGTQVIALARPSYIKTDGIAGVRINHHLDVHVDGFAIKSGA